MVTAVTLCLSGVFVVHNFIGSQTRTELHTSHLRPWEIVMMRRPASFVRILAPLILMWLPADQKQLGQLCLFSQRLTASSNHSFQIWHLCKWCECSTHMSQGMMIRFLFVCYRPNVVLRARFRHARLSRKLQGKSECMTGSGALYLHHFAGSSVEQNPTKGRERKGMSWGFCVEKEETKTSLSRNGFWAEPSKQAGGIAVERKGPAPRGGRRNWLDLWIEDSEMILKRIVGLSFDLTWRYHLVGGI